MTNDAIDSWIKNAKSGTLSAPVTPGVKVIKRVPKSKGNIIMEMAEKIRPWLMKMFEGVRDENGMLLQPAHIRGIALNVAQSIIKEEENK